MQSQSTFSIFIEMLPGARVGAGQSLRRACFLLASRKSDAGSVFPLLWGRGGADSLEILPAISQTGEALIERRHRR